MRRFVIAVIGALLLGGGAASAQPVDPGASGPVAPTSSNPKVLRAAARSRLDDVLSALGGQLDRADSIRFSEEFLVATPREQAIEAIKRNASPEGGYEVLETRFFDQRTIGAWVRAKSDRTRYLTVRLGIEAIQPHRISVLEIKPAPPPGTSTGGTWGELDALIAEQPFRVSVAAMERRADGSLVMLHEVAPDARMGLGAMGTIFAHLALAGLVSEGGATWERPLAFDDSLRSLPDSRSSMLVLGTELPLSEYAHRAMSENDNTCADHLITMLGRERIERSRDAVRAAAAAQAGVDPASLAAGEPFLSVMENYRLKCGVTMLIKRYAEGSNEERRRLLEEEVPKSEVHPTLLRLWAKPQELARVGWTATARELCHVGGRLAELAAQPGGAWALDALRVPDRDQPGKPLSVIAGRQAGEPGAMAGLWIIPRGGDRFVIVAMICNNDQRVLAAERTAKLAAKLLDVASAVP